MKLVLDDFDSPIGHILLVTEGSQLISLDFADYRDRMHRLLERRKAIPEVAEGRAPAQIRERLAAYFDGDVEAIHDIPFQSGGTLFQQKVWAELRATRAGQTRSYSDVALTIGMPKACRAVGLANGSNPIAIVIPCHRIVGRSGQLTGYAGGVARKQWLLDHEQHHQPALRTQQTLALTQSA